MIQQGYTQSFLRDLLKGKHDFESHTFKIALYTDAADLSPLTTNYTTTGEVVGTGYVAGGTSLTPTVTLLNGVALVDFEDVTWAGATLTARGALIYNTTSDGGVGTTDAVYVINFGSDRTKVGADFTVRFPAPTEQYALLRLKG